MESSEVIRDEKNTSKNSSWENTMENVAADGASGVEQAHSDGSQRDQLPVPDGINRMMNNGYLHMARYCPDNIFNGIRTAQMKIEKPIPSTVGVVGVFIRLWYPGQPKSCRRCGDLGQDCTLVRCFNCEKAGYRAEDCEEPDTCSICRSYDHRESHCPYLLYSANV